LKPAPGGGRAPAETFVRKREHGPEGAGFTLRPPLSPYRTDEEHCPWLPPGVRSPPGSAPGSLSGTSGALDAAPAQPPARPSCPSNSSLSSTSFDRLRDRATADDLAMLGERVRALAARVERACREGIASIGSPMRGGADPGGQGSEEGAGDASAQVGGEDTGGLSVREGPRAAVLG
jgi:hypothetical protein